VLDADPVRDAKRVHVRGISQERLDHGRLADSWLAGDEDDLALARLGPLQT
jgi:hypothetical protein